MKIFLSRINARGLLDPECCWKKGNSWTAFQHQMAVIWTTLYLRQFRGLLSTSCITPLPTSDPLSTTCSPWPVSEILILFLPLDSNFICADIIDLSFQLMSFYPAITDPCGQQSRLTKINLFAERDVRISNLAVFILGDSNISPCFLPLQLNSTSNCRFGLLKCFHAHFLPQSWYHVPVCW